MTAQAAVGVCLCTLGIAACGGKSATTTSHGLSPPPRAVSTKIALRWPHVFCALKPGVSQAQAIQLMGAASSTGTDAAGAAELEWSALGYGFFADLNPARDTVTTLEVVPDAEASPDPRMTSRLRGCPWLSSR